MTTRGYALGPQSVLREVADLNRHISSLHAGTYVVLLNRTETYLGRCASAAFPEQLRGRGNPQPVLSMLMSDLEPHEGRTPSTCQLGLSVRFDKSTR